MAFAVEEGFFPPAPGVGSFIGPAPRLAVADELTAYARVDYLQGFTYTGVRLLPSTAKMPTLDVSVQLSADDDLDFYEVYLNRLTVNGGLGDNLELTNTNTSVAGIVPGGQWVAHTFRLTAGIDYNQDDVEAALAAGRLAILVSADAAPSSQIAQLRVSQILVGATVTYLRNHARDDGLGGNAPRNHPRTSQQRSLRNKGYR